LVSSMHVTLHTKHFFVWGGGVSNPLCLSSSSALHFFRLFFLCLLPCQLG
jgi:hypothetical protein